MVIKISVAVIAAAFASLSVYLIRSVTNSVRQAAELLGSKLPPAIPDALPATNHRVQVRVKQNPR